jgi:preprotein translocase subunit SecA
MRKVEHWLLLESIDSHWREHLTAIDDLRQSIGLQAYAQVDPLVAFKKEGYDMYQQLQENIRRQVARTVFKVRITERPAEQTPAPDNQAGPGAESKPAPNLPGSRRPTPLRTNRDEPSTPRSPNGQTPKVGRNDPCYCGSGRKYKKCHGAVA